MVQAWKQIRADLPRSPQPLLIFRSAEDHVVDAVLGGRHAGTSRRATSPSGCSPTATTWPRSTTTPRRSSRSPRTSSARDRGDSDAWDDRADDYRDGASARAPATRTSAWRAIVDNYGDRVPRRPAGPGSAESRARRGRPRGRRPAVPAAPSHARRSSPTRRDDGSTGRRPRGPLRPPPPPPLPTPEPPRAGRLGRRCSALRCWCWCCVVLRDRPPSWASMAAGLAWFVGGFGYLVATMRRKPTRRRLGRRRRHLRPSPPRHGERTGRECSETVEITGHLMDSGILSARPRRHPRVRRRLRHRQLRRRPRGRRPLARASITVTPRTTRRCSGC